MAAHTLRTCPAFRARVSGSSCATSRRLGLRIAHSLDPKTRRGRGDVVELSQLLLKCWSVFDVYLEGQPLGRVHP